FSYRSLTLAPTLMGEWHRVGCHEAYRGADPRADDHLNDSCADFGASVFRDVERSRASQRNTDELTPAMLDHTVSRSTSHLEQCNVGMKVERAERLLSMPWRALSKRSSAGKRISGAASLLMGETQHRRYSSTID